MKVDAKTKALLDDYKGKKREKEGKKPLQHGETLDEEELDAETLKQDAGVKISLASVLKENEHELSKVPSEGK